MNNKHLSELKQQYVAKGAPHMIQAFADTAENAEIWDVEGNRYIDFAGGIGVLNLGHRHPKVVEAIKAQLDKVMHTSAAVMPYAPYVHLCKRLCDAVPITGDTRAVLVNSGAEAVENAVKIARAATGRSAVIAFDGSFHGRTMMTLALTGKVLPYKHDFGPMPGDVFRAPYPNPTHGVSDEQSLAAIEKLFKTDVPAHRVAAIIIEPVQGEGGFYQASPAFMQSLRALCDEHGIVLIADEVQSGFARTGKLFAIEHTDVEPDLITTAKSLADGMPLAAVVGKADMMDASGPGSLGGTYGGNPLSCAAAIAVMDAIEEEDILGRSQRMGEALAERFHTWQARFSHVDHSRNVGAMAAFELVDEHGAPCAVKTKALTQKAAENGLILLSCGFYSNTIRVLVPLTATDDVLHEGLDIIERCLEEL
ncbi:4-aminobutyrate--2-oxoglutarate transaminase [Larsenimonas suaedae]|uniref:4-aminobutyrate--2-oxoglutarate transaminase n=1 Tax=Larsenimonas suaedae TaxID=1851019 RepID=A0ABU1GUP5_9GAMM|nr:4-aminobutyrate--2-oxoglutarate transaminase [Larsenimonas suaedae]MCM2971065.1 4-aminobutyrate--2-oxoglutarate transaminase [Larsenimonas suaedae]MDR5895774.1 4-aminobutyrate--2-oxoglutarate transaminase [Larsenimonas suaedae]